MKFFYDRFALLFNEAAGGDAGGGAAPPAAAVAAPGVDAAPPPAVATPPAGPTGFVNADGTFVDGWQSREEFKDLAGLERFKDIPTLVKSYKALESKIGAPPAAPGPPAADAAPEVVAAYREANGIPSTPDAYQLKPAQLPEGVVWSDDMAKQFGAVFHKYNIPAAAAQQIAAAQVAYEAQAVKTASEAYKTQLANDEAALKQEWGNAYQQKVDGIKSVATSLGFDPQDPQLFSNPKVVGFLGKVVSQLSPDSVAQLGVTVGQGGKFLSSKDEATAIMTDPNHPDYARYYAGDETIVKKVATLAGQY